MQSIGERVSDPRGSGTVLAIALMFFALGCGLMLVTGASLAALHAFAAFIVLAFVAASNQLIPVLTGAPVSPPRIVVLTATPLTIGFAFLVASFLGAPFFALAGVLLLLGAIAWVAWIAGRLLRATSERAIAALMGVATVALLAVATIGATMTLALGGRIPADVLVLAPLHALLALGVFASTAILAVSMRFVPMFALAHVTHSRTQPIARWSFVVGTVVASLCFAHPIVVRIALAITIVALVVVGRGHLHELRLRIRRRLDMSLRYASVGWVSALVAIVAAFAATWWRPAAGAAVALALLGWASITVLGYAYKIAGFLAWQYARMRRSDARLPALGTAIPESLAMVGLLLLSIGVLATALSLAFDPRYMRWAFIPYACGAIAVLISYWRLTRPYLGGPSWLSS